LFGYCKRLRISSRFTNKNNKNKNNNTNNNDNNNNNKVDINIHLDLKPPVAHLDMKTPNIFLNESDVKGENRLVAKIADFGTSQVCC
jgi:serine/threonine protein kinase